MKFTSTTVAILSALIAKTAFAGNFNYGFAIYTDHYDLAIWLNGEDACNYTYLGPIDENPCSYNDGCFKLWEVDYKMVGCGTSNFCIENPDGSQNSCAVHGLENPIPGCKNEYGDFSVWQQSYFPPITLS